MSKLFQKFKKLISGFTAVILMASIITPGVAFAAIPVVTVSNLVTNDATPTLSGTVTEPGAVITVTVNAVDYVATNNLDGTWVLADNTITPALGDGVYAVSVVAVDPIDGPGLGTGSLTVDTIGPSLAEVTPVETPTNNQTPSYTFSSNEPGTITYVGACDSADVSAVAGLNNVTFSTLAEGLYGSCSLGVTDLAGNSTNLEISDFEIDVTAPVIAGITSGAFYNALDLPRTITATDNSDADVAIELDGSVLVNPVLAEGHHSVVATDDSGNITSATFTIDLTDPGITLGVAPFVQIERGSAFSATADDVDTTDNLSPVSVNVAYDIDTDVMDTYTVTYSARDAAKNGPVVVTRLVEVVDELPPFIAAINYDSNVTNTEVLWCGEALDRDESGTKSYPIDSYSWDEATGIVAINPFSLVADGSCVYLSAATDGSEDGVYTIELTATDEAGNPGADSRTLTWDTTPLNPSAGDDFFTNQNTVTLSGNADVDGVDLSGLDSVEWTQVDGPAAATVTNPTALTTTVSGLTADGVYLFNLEVTDNAGNVSNDMVAVTRDTVEPVVVDLRVITDYAGIYVDGDGFEVRADVSDERSGIDALSCQYTIDGNNWYPASFDGANEECYISGVTATDTSELEINIGVSDRAGNVGIGNEIYRDADAPSVNAGTDIRTNKSEVLAATTSDSASGIATYAWSQVSGPVGGTLTFTTTDIEDAAVVADKDGIYVARLTVTDNVGNVNYDEVVIEWDTKVNAVSSLKAIPGDKQIKLSWVNPADKDLDVIKIYRSLKAGELGDLVATLAKTEQGFVNLGLVNGTTYFYTVETLDTLGNSAKTAQVSATPRVPTIAEILTPVVATVGGYFDNNVVADDFSEMDEEKEVMSDETQKDEKDDAKTETSDSDVPMVGIIILILLIALGLYLLYLQNPEMFSKLAFWNKNKKGSITLGSGKGAKSKAHVKRGATKKK